MSCDVMSGRIISTLKLIEHVYRFYLFIYFFIGCGLLILGKRKCYIIKILNGKEQLIQI